MSILLTSDLHLTAKQTDSYRWGLFDWIIDLIPKYDIKYIILAGDTSDQKDNHSSKFTNKVVETLAKLASHVTEVILLRGNHDYIDQNLPYFKFINEIPKLSFIIQPNTSVIDGKKTLLLPNSRDPLNDWQDIIPSFNDFNLIILHQTFKGSLAENGTELNGLDKSIFDNINAEVWSGDVHVPQKIGNINYVGSPYHIHFGDSFFPRVVILNNNGIHNELHYPTLMKYTLVISDPDELEQIKSVKPNDQIKVRLKLTDPLAWNESKQKILDIGKRRGLDIHRVELLKNDSTIKPKEAFKVNYMTEQQILEDYVKHAKVPEAYKQFGIACLED